VAKCPIASRNSAADTPEAVGVPEIADAPETPDTSEASDTPEAAAGPGAVSVGMEHLQSAERTAAPSGSHLRLT
jgi:hypothetical protein